MLTKLNSGERVAAWKRSALPGTMPTPRIELASPQNVTVKPCIRANPPRRAPGGYAGASAVGSVPPGAPRGATAAPSWRAPGGRHWGAPAVRGGQTLWTAI